MNPLALFIEAFFWLMVVLLAIVVLALAADPSPLIEFRDSLHIMRLDEGW